MSFDKNDDGGGSPALNDNSRRRFMVGSAEAFGGALSTSAPADEHGDERGDDGEQGSGDGWQGYSPYGGNDTKTAPTVGNVNGHNYRDDGQPDGDVRLPGGVT